MLFPHYAYVNAENLDDRLALEEDPRGFLAQYGDSGIVIDEAQRVPAIFSYLQPFVDDTRVMGKIILSGSQNFLLMEKITQSLAGRVGLVNLFPFTLEELKPTRYWYEDVTYYLFSGMYPAIYDRGIEPVDYYPNYLQTYVERDVRSIKNIGDLNTFSRFLQLCAARVGQVLNYSSIANDLGIDHKTAKSWISVLEASYIIFLLNPHFKNYNKRVIKQPKLYFYDTGLATSLLRIRRKEDLYSFYLKGNLFENFIISEYVKNSFHAGRQPDAFFFRDSSGNEIDLIIDRSGFPIPVEIKSGATINQEFFKGLQKYQELSNVLPEESFLVYSGDISVKRKYAQVLSWKDLGRLGGSV